MADSQARKRRRLQDMAGGWGVATVGQSRQGHLVHAVTCRVCTDKSGDTYRADQTNSYTDALTRWALHLTYTHPGAEAPCLAKMVEIKAAQRAERARS